MSAVAHAEHPVVTKLRTRRAADAQLKIADAITAFAGSMPFVYVHVVVFAVWMLFVEKSPWPTLTLVVSLEAIFLSTFVMIGQNRQASIQQAKADHDFASGEQELHSNTELTRQVHQLTTEIHSHLVPVRNGTTPTVGGDHRQCHMRCPKSSVSVARSFPVVASSAMKLGASGRRQKVWSWFTPLAEVQYRMLPSTSTEHAATS